MTIGLGLDRACYLVGRYFHSFGAMEDALDGAIIKALGLEEDARGRIVTSNLDFVKKVKMLESVIIVRLMKAACDLQRSRSLVVFRKLLTILAK